MMVERLGIAMTVNGGGTALEVAVHHTLLDVLRDDLGLTGTKECCAEGECGACTILIDGRPVNSCLVLAVEADGCEVTTIEGLGGGDRLGPIQEAFVAAGGVQCGFCIPGMVVSAHALLSGTARPTMAEIREGLSGNLCRCGGYNQICAAVASAAEAT
jgi:aerobic-type carbon monoxide dehydrogenase small subunit (CoxS/CutS family)